MAHQFAHIDVAVVQQDVAVAVRMAQNAQEVMAHVGVGVAAVNEGKVDLRQPARGIVGEELRARELVVRDQPLDAEAAEVRPYLLDVVPLRRAADSAEGAMLEHGIRRVDEAQLALVVVLQPEGEADDAEAVARTDDQHVARAQRAHQAVVQEAEAEIEIVRFLVVSERLGVIENRAQYRGIEAEWGLIGPIELQHVVIVSHDRQLSRVLLHRGRKRKRVVQVTRGLFRFDCKQVTAQRHPRVRATEGRTRRNA